MKAGEARKYVTGFEFMQTDPVRVIHGAVRVKPKLEWRLQDVGDARNMVYL
jgi:hypothetical protein